MPPLIVSTLRGRGCECPSPLVDEDTCVYCGRDVDVEPPPPRPPRPPRGQWTRLEIIDRIVWWNETHGRPPYCTDWSKPAAQRGPFPNVDLVRHRFGTWRAAIEAAGFKADPRGRKSLTPAYGTNAPSPTPAVPHPARWCRPLGPLPADVARR
jgi:Homing endonuclease associated repeat